MNTALVTIAIGKDCQRMWCDVFEPSVRAYADRHGYDVHCLCAPIDAATTKPPQWQKLLLAGHPGLAKYDRIVYVDSDVMCNPESPDIAATVPDGKIGAVTWKGSYFSDPVWLDWFRQTWHRNEAEKFRNANIQSFADLAEFGGYPRNDDWLNSGVLVYSNTKEVADFLLNVFYEEQHTEKSSAEQQALTHHLCNLRPDLLCPLDRRFNAIAYIERSIHYPFIAELYQESFFVSRIVESMLKKNYFLHFAADGERQHARVFMRHQHLLEQQEVAA